MLSPFAKARLERDGLQKRLSLGASPPRDGWIRAVRSALGLRTVQLARRLGVRPQAIAEFERSERERRITLHSLDRIAAAMGCRVEYFFVPQERSFETVFENQAKTYLKHARSEVAHSMELEGQGVKSVRNSLDDAWTLISAYREIWDVDGRDVEEGAVREGKENAKAGK